MDRDQHEGRLEAHFSVREIERFKAAHFVRVAVHGKTKPLLHTHHMWHTAAAALGQVPKPPPAIESLEKSGGFGLPNYQLFRGEDGGMNQLGN
jgi:hypothetical protein